MLAAAQPAGADAGDGDAREPVCVVPEVIRRVLDVFVHEHAEMSEGLSFHAFRHASNVFSLTCILELHLSRSLVAPQSETNREQGSPLYRLHQHGRGPATQRVAGARVLEVGAGSDQNPMLPS